MRDGKNKLRIKKQDASEEIVRIMECCTVGPIHINLCQPAIGAAYLLMYSEITDLYFLHDETVVSVDEIK